MGETTIHHLLFERDGKTTEFTAFDDIPTIDPDGTLSRPPKSPLEATVLNIIIEELQGRTIRVEYNLATNAENTTVHNILHAIRKASERISKLFEDTMFNMCFDGNDE